MKLIFRLDCADEEKKECKAIEIITNVDNVINKAPSLCCQTTIYCSLTGLGAEIGLPDVQNGK